VSPRTDGAAGSSDARTLDDAQLAQLEEERDFLLRSLDDLDEEHRAGDVDEVDYQALRDDYTRRAANVLRAIESRRARVAVPRGRSWTGAVAWIAGVLVVGVLAGVLLGRATGSRGSGELSGDIRESTRTLIAEAQAAFAQGDPDGALALYDEALRIAPGNVEALAYRGWIRYRSGGDEAQALGDLDEAVLVDPSFPDARIFRASILLDQGDADAAAEDLAAFDELANPPPMADQLLVSFRLRERIALARVEAALFAGEVPDDPVAAVTDAGLTVEDLTLAAEQLVETGDLGRAVLVVDTGLDLDPASPSMLALLGWIDALASQSDATTEAQREVLVPRALEALGRAVELDPAYPAARVYRALLLSELGRGEESAADLEVFCASSRDRKLQGYLDAAGLECAP
jgi:tetratricopeptide (TPR) repeat protein